MAWLKLTFTVSDHVAEEFSDWLLQSGAVSVSLTGATTTAILEPEPDRTPLWERVNIAVLLEEDCNVAALLMALATQFPLENTTPISREVIAEQDWQQTFQQDFPPICITPHLWICPSWRSVPDPQAVTILLDPGLAFGTGKHPTTALCLQWLAQNIKPGDQVIDYGCGSGILAIAAAKLGAAKVYAIDHDQQALLATSENMARNQINPQTIAIMSPEYPPPVMVDKIVANILAQPLKELAGNFALRMKSGGQIALSGILTTQCSAVREAYDVCFHNCTVTQQEEWALLSMWRK